MVTHEGFISCKLTVAGLAVVQQPVTLVTAAAVAIKHAQALVITTVVPKRTVVDH